MFIKWDNKYSVKNALIDSQHKKLFELANAAHDMIGKQTNPNEVRKVLAALFDYMKTHFRDEEVYMERIKYPGLAAHRDKHRRIVMEMTALVKNIGVDLKDKLVVIMDQWILNHIMQDDMEYMKFLQERNAKQTQIKVQAQVSTNKPQQPIATPAAASANNTTKVADKVVKPSPSSVASNAKPNTSVSNVAKPKVEKPVAKPVNKELVHVYRCLCGKLYNMKPDVHASIQSGQGIKCPVCTTFIKYIKDM